MGVVMKNNSLLLKQNQEKRGAKLSRKSFSIGFLFLLFLFLLIFIPLNSAWLDIGEDDPSMPRVIISPEITTISDAYAFAHTNDTIPVVVTGTWYNITFDDEEHILKNGITHTHNDSTNYSFYIEKAGIYEIFGSVSFIDTSANAENEHMVYRIVKNGVEVLGSFWEGDFTKQDTENKRNFLALVECSVGDSLGLQFSGDSVDISLIARDTVGYSDTHGHSSSLIIRRI